MGQSHQYLSAKFIHYQLAVLGIDILELPAGKDHPGCVINDNQNLEIRPTRFMPIDVGDADLKHLSYSDLSIRAPNL
jgi:hypothetical protein